MKCTIYIPSLTFHLSLLPHTTALIEPEPATLTPIAAASFIDTSALPPPNTAFYDPSENAVSSFVQDVNLSMKEEALGLEPGSIRIDGRSGKMASLDLSKPILPGGGVGNHLLWSVGPTLDEVGRENKHGPPVEREEWGELGVRAVKNWMLDHQSDLEIDASNELFPSHSKLQMFKRNLQDREGPRETNYVPLIDNIRTAVHGDDGDMIQISIQRTFKGVKVVDSRATATIKLGNLVNVGLEEWGDIDERFNVEPRLTTESAYRALAFHTGLTLTDEVTCKPELQIIITGQDLKRKTNSLRFSDPKPAMGYGHTLVWKVCPKFEGQDIEMMEGIVDATTGTVLSFLDTVDYLVAKGDVYPYSNDSNGEEGKLQEGWPMPFMTVGVKVTDTGGNYRGGGFQTAKLTGPYVEMRDLCGSGYVSGSKSYGIATLTQSNGIDWGGSGGTDCATPGYGTASNTHASRTGFYELNKIMEIARSRLPSNTWLKGKLNSNMNLDASCNAYWNGEVNFYRSSAACANTGELAGVFDHEWGHGLDDHDVDGRISKPSGEGIADVYTALRLDDSCIGRGFYKGGSCSGNGNPCTTCTGVRDIDYMKRGNKTPSTYTWAKNTCGTSVHCLGYVYSEAIWSLYKRELNSFYGYDENTSLEIVTRLTYIAAGNVQTWFDGYTKSPSGIWRGGCGSNSGYLSYLAADDDNGKITDGTPHMKAIFKAFNDQEIACDSPAVRDSGCSGKPTDAPIVTAVGGKKQVILTWTAVPRASKYQVFRTEGTRQCEQGKVLLATLNSNTFSYKDEGLTNGREYYYIVIAKGNDSCFGPSSSCTPVTPDDGPGLELDCDNDPLVIPVNPTTSTTQYRNCAIYGTGGFSGSVLIGCGSQDSLAINGVTCSASPSTVLVSSSVSTIVLSIKSTSAAAGTGEIVVSGISSTASSSTTIPVTLLAAGGAQSAEFDTTYSAPRCSVWGYECSSGNLLVGRGTITGGNEQSAPNTVNDSCADGNSGTYGTDESIEKIVVRSGWTNGVGSGQPMVKGGRATIIATVHSYGSGTDDFADFYYATDDSSSWKFITTNKPSSGGFTQIMVDYQLPQATVHRIRVNFRYNGVASPCTVGSYNDHDDLVFAVADVSTPAPVTPSPSKKPSNKPTSLTKNPTNFPTNRPTSHPTNFPTPLPTSKPTHLPTGVPTRIPTAYPTRNPIPITTTTTTTTTTTSSTTTTNTVTSPPTEEPTSNPLTAPPSIENEQQAIFDNDFGVPRCLSVGHACTSGSLLKGRGFMSGGAEPNTANTLLDDCKADGSSGTYLTDESLDKIVVRSGEIDGSGSDSILTEGGRATIIATVFSWGSGANDNADFFYTSDASNPDWNYIGSITPPGGGVQDLKIAYNLPQGTNQAVRVQFRYKGTIGSCTFGSYNDRDDLMFMVSDQGQQPTRSPVKSYSPTDSTGRGPQQAVFDPSLKVPRCSSYGSECDSLDLLNGRGLMKDGNELHMSNVLDSCRDGSSGTYQNDESLEKIVIRSGDIDGSGSGVDMMEGGRATIIATVFPWKNGRTDYADFYYASDSSNPIWQFIGTVQPDGSGAQEVKVAYTLPAGNNQAVRVNFRYRGAQGINGACSYGSYDDADDLAFRVKSNPSHNAVEVDQVSPKEEVKDVIADEMKRKELRVNNSGSRKRSKGRKI